MAIGAALPIGKLLSLFIKTLSKPISKRVKKDFSRFESTQRFLVWTGQGVSKEKLIYLTSGYTQQEHIIHIYMTKVPQYHNGDFIL